MIELVLSSLSIDEVPGRVALTTFFENQRPLKGSAGLVDWRLNGRLSELILQGKISGYFSESIIMPAQGRLAARDILVFGLGSSQELSESKIEEGFQVWIDKLALLKASEVVISFGDLAKDFMSWRSLLRNFITSLSEKKKALQVICADDARWISETKKRNMDFGPDVNLSYA